jgi:hypothetical protein
MWHVDKKETLMKSDLVLTDVVVAKEDAPFEGYFCPMARDKGFVCAIKSRALFIVRKISSH